MGSILQKQGRFEVYEGDMNMSPPVSDGAVLLEQHLGGNKLPDLTTRLVLALSATTHKLSHFNLDIMSSSAALPTLRVLFNTHL